MELTREQQLAVDIRDCNVLVSAAAGSGKTSVLVKRIVSRITSGDPVNIDRLLIMTFTNAAAAEMKSRIRDAIESEISRLCKEAEPDAEKIAHLRKQSMIAHNAMITTIHGFCKSVVTDHFEEVSLDPNFRIADENECKLMMQDALEECLEAAYEKASPAFLEAVECFSKAKNDSGLADLIIPMYRFVVSSPDPEEFIKQCRNCYDLDSYEEFERSELFESYVNRIAGGLNRLSSVAQKALSLIDDNEGIEPYRACINAYKEGFDAIIRDIENAGASSEDKKRSFWIYGIIRKGLGLIDPPSLKPIREAGLEASEIEAKKAVASLRGDMKKELEKLRELVVFDTEDIYRHIMIAKGPLFAITDVVSDFAAVYKEKKRQQNVIDFNDMEHMAVSILRNPDIAAIYREQFVEIYVDEYQDSNMTQEVLVSLICRPDAGNVFQVGDVKQSIYRFRHARPDLFLSKYSSYSDEKGENRRILLNDNFRSRDEVVDAVNEVFTAIMKSDTGGIEYDDDAMLKRAADYYEQPPSGKDPYRAEILIGVPGDLSDEEFSANTVANRIMSMIRDGYRVYDKSRKITRPATFRDFTILVRSMKKYDKAFRDVFASAGIPLFVNGREGYFGTVEVQTVLSFLSAVDNPLCDIELAALARCPVGGFTDKDMAEITAAAGNDKSLYHRIKAVAADREDDELKAKCVRLLELLARYRDMSGYTPVSGIISDFIDKEYADHVRCMGKQEQRMANLALLLAKAEDYGRTSFKGLYRFVRYMDQIRKYEIDDGEAGTVGENDDVVRLMTMHSSKGLEFPVCFVVGLEKRRNILDETGKVIWNNRFGFGVDYVDINRRITGTTLPKMLVREENKTDSIAEEMRVLYVAMTRAREKLVMVGIGKEDIFDGPAKPIENSLTYFDMLKHAHGTEGFEHIDVSIVTEADLVLGRFEEEIEKEDASERIMAIIKDERCAKDTDKTGNITLPEYLAHVRDGYPYPIDKDLRMKLSVSDLKHKAIEEKKAAGELLTGDEPLFGETEPEKYIPRFARSEGETATGGTFYGTAFHRIMELWEYPAGKESDTVTKEDITAFAEKMHGLHRMERQQADAIRPDDVAFFINSELGRRMRKAKEEGKLFREQPFVIGVDRSGEMILVQGIIDAYFVEEDGITIVDYKTDRVDNEEMLIGRYKAQLEYYGIALSQITGRPVKDLLIYSTRLRKAISVA
ncbi:MAG: helicase-exonuclease AddAB subunit AddA [Lachnospiraceae bacterium]|nr:helicase-exonuclease AddAB subunit AddA [Lachnospiraceae bacterium]